MANVIKLNDYLKRQKELFDAYIKSSGKEISVDAFKERYELEDGVAHTSDDLLKYIYSYVKSKRITEAELSSYNDTKKVPNDIVFKRGRIIIESLIASQGNTQDLEKLASEFAKKDGKIHPYDNKYLLKCRDYYMRTSKNADILMAYKNVCELVTRGSYDIELPIKILEITDNSKAIEFINRISISKSSLRKLVNEYETLYPANTANITRLNYLLKEAYKTDDKVVKFYDVKQNHDTLKDRLVSLRRILEEYLISDREDISELFDKYHFNSYKFKETLKDARSGRDILLNSLIDKYEAKNIAIDNMYKEILTKIMQAKYNGINYGYGYREFNIYDYYMLKEGNSMAKLIKYANKIYTEEDASVIVEVVKECEVTNVVSRDHLAESHKKENPDLILDYLEYASLPLSEEMFEAVYTRFSENDISFEVVETPKSVNMWIN